MPAHEDELEERCVFCGQSQPAEAFEDGLRCPSCVEEQDDA